MRRAVVTAALVVGLGTTLAVASQLDSAGTQVDDGGLAVLADTTTATPLVPKGSSPAAVIGEFAARLDPSGDTIVSAQLADVPDSFLAPGTPGPGSPSQLSRSDPWLHVTTAEADPDIVSGLLRDWKVALLVGAVRDATAASGAPLVGFDVSRAAAAAKPAFVEAGRLGAISPHQAFAEGSDDEIRTSVQERARSHAIAIVDVSFLHGGAPIPIIRVQAVGDSRAFLLAHRTDLQTDLLGANPNNYEGYAIVVETKTGEPILVTASSARGGRGSLWIAPELVCDELQPGTGSSAVPPPTCA